MKCNEHFEHRPTMSDKSRLKWRTKLERDTEKFLQSGGEIQQVDYGVVTEEELPGFQERVYEGLNTNRVTTNTTTPDPAEDDNEQQDEWDIRG